MGGLTRIVNMAEKSDETTDVVTIVAWDGSTGLYVVNYRGMAVGGVGSASGTVYALGVQVLALIRGSRVESIA